MPRHLSKLSEAMLANASLEPNSSRLDIPTVISRIGQALGPLTAGAANYAHLEETRLRLSL